DGQWNRVPGHLVAFDALTLKVLWRDDNPISYAKFCPPTIADGKVYRATFANQLVVYGLKPAPPHFAAAGTGPAVEAPIRHSIEEKQQSRGGGGGVVGHPTGPEAHAATAGVRHRHYAGKLRGLHRNIVSVVPAASPTVPSCDRPPDVTTPVESSIYWSA